MPCNHGLAARWQKRLDMHDARQVQTTGQLQVLNVPCENLASLEGKH